MSAPVTERPRTGTPTIPDQRTRSRRTGAAGRGRGTEGVSRRGAAERAYQRRDDRLRRLGGLWAGYRLGRAAATPGRTPFVLLVMALLGIGLVAILWLSTAAAADSYKLTDARSAARTLQEQSEVLRREVATKESAPEIARQAEALGLVVVRDPARIVVAPDGTSSVVGQPRAASRPAPPAPPAAEQPAPAPDAAAQPGGETSEASTQQEQTPTEQNPPAAGAGRG
ncbi:hypothetical protein ACQEVB_21300 [Pseudonocardia sp. CA-107938]|uniref:hypothetical protein n=1 Tax=Pseudonocardia sp. CA-107938 TaxID=3240021 RepID=UPI003D8A09BF